MTYNESKLLAEELCDSFLNGNISWVMNQLNTYSKSEAMLLTLHISQLLSSNCQSFERALVKRL